MFDAKWSCDEELKLLEAIEIFGFGNWGEIASNLGRSAAGEKEKKQISVQIFF